MGSNSIRECKTKQIILLLFNLFLKMEVLSSLFFFSHFSLLFLGISVLPVENGLNDQLFGAAAVGFFFYLFCHLLHFENIFFSFFKGDLQKVKNLTMNGANLDAIDYDKRYVLKIEE